MERAFASVPRRLVLKLHRNYPQTLSKCRNNSRFLAFISCSAILMIRPNLTPTITYVQSRGVATGVDIGIYTPSKKISPSKLFMG